MQHELTPNFFSMQQIQIIGNLGADAEVREFNGSQFTTFRVGVSEKISTTDGPREVTTWYSCSYNRDTTRLLPYLKKGQMVFVEGKPSYSMYDSAVHRCKMIDVKIFVNQIQLCGPRPSQPADTSQPPIEKPDEDEPPF